MSEEIVQAKVALRERLRAEAVRRGAELELHSRAICERVQQQKVWREAELILLYAALAGEPNINGLLEAGLAAGKRVVLPRSSPNGEIYEACRILNPVADLRRGRYGISEPVADCPVVELNKLDLALIPGVGFAFNGGRLGRGKGHFDRMLSQVRGWKCGVALDWQVIGEIPSQEHDVRVDSIVTPTRWHIVAQAAAT